MKHILAGLLFVVGMFLWTQVLLAEPDMFMVTDAGTSARMVRLGKLEGFSTTAAGIFENPASLYAVPRFSASAFRSEFIREVPYQNFALAGRISNVVLGWGYMGVTVSDIDKTSASASGLPVREGTFQYKNQLIKLGAAYSFSRHLHVGLSGTLYEANFDTVSATGYNSDFGVYFDNPRLDVSLAFKNLIPSQKFQYSDSSSDLDNSSNGQFEKIPLQTSLSLRYAFKYVTIYGQLKKTGQQDGFVKNGALEFTPPYLDFLRLSVGYKESLIPVQRNMDKVATDVVESGPVFGVGLDLWGLQFDYALEKSDHVQFDTIHYFSAAVSF